MAILHFPWPMHARAWAKTNGIPFLEGADVVAALGV